MDKDKQNINKNELNDRAVLAQKIMEMQGLPEEIVKKFLDVKGVLSGKNIEKE